jgi:hypothetical protein
MGCRCVSSVLVSISVILWLRDLCGEEFAFGVDVDCQDGKAFLDARISLWPYSSHTVIPDAPAWIQPGIAGERRL